MNRSILMLTLLAGGLAALTACGSPRHLQYDFGRAYTMAFTAQADLTRPSVANKQYPLYGIEGAKIRILVQEATTEQESGTSEIQQ
jgi:hypothetical protein